MADEGKGFRLLKTELAAAPFASIVSENTTLGLAVSGGPDSLALLLLMHRARPGRIAAATVDHQLRPESRAEAEMIAALCAKLGVPHNILTVAVKKGGNGTQANARVERYDALAQWAKQHGLVAIATAHHLDDQAETFLMRANRGAGLSGLAGIRPITWWRGTLPLIRPLLSWRRTTLEDVVRDAGLIAADDPSNHDPSYDRSRMRALIAREAELSPVRLAHSASALQDVDYALTWVATRIVADHLCQDGDALMMLGHDLPHYFQRVLIEHAVQRLAPEAAPLRGQEVDIVLRALESGGKSTLRGLLFSGGAQWKITFAPPKKQPKAVKP